MDAKHWFLFISCSNQIQLFSFNCSGKGNKPYISLPKGKGIKLTIAEERDKRLAQK